MSVESWKREFYPVDATQVAKEDALAHSLKKWEGLMKENLERHGVELCYRGIRDKDGEHFNVDKSTCALCFHHDKGFGCPTCPLSIMRGRVRCDLGAGEDNPYLCFLRKNPLPMLRLLRKAMKTMKDKE